MRLVSCILCKMNTFKHNIKAFVMLFDLAIHINVYDLIHTFQYDLLCPSDVKVMGGVMVETTYTIKNIGA